MVLNFCTKTSQSGTISYSTISKSGTTFLQNFALSTTVTEVVNVGAEILSKFSFIFILFSNLSSTTFLQNFKLNMAGKERWGAGVETQKNVRGEIGGWGRVPFNETYAPSLSTIYDGA